MGFIKPLLSMLDDETLYVMARDIVADEVEFLTPQNQQSGAQSAPGAYTTAASKDSGTAYAPQPHDDFGGGFTQVDDEELPF